MWREIPCGFCLEEDTPPRAPLPGLFQSSRDADAITAAFQEFPAAGWAGRKPAIRDRLEQAKEQAGAETGAPDTGPGESQNQESGRAEMNIKTDFDQSLSAVRLIL